MKKVTFYILIWIVGILMFACTGSSKYPDYKNRRHGIYYKLLEIGDSAHIAKTGDYITIDITYKTISDSVFFKAKRKLQVQKPTYEGSIDECFSMLSLEDRVCFIISADSLFTKTLQTNLPSFIHSGSDMKVEIKLLEIQTEEEFQRQKEAFLKWIEDFGEYEKIILKQFIEQRKIDVKTAGSGIYYLKLIPGNGRKVNKGDTVTVDYEGKFLNGKFFDSTIQRKEPFQFVYGQEWQVIKGVEEAIGLMEENEKALFIIPSELAFGITGSSTGIIPPYTSVIFEIELKKVSKEKIESGTKK